MVLVVFHLTPWEFCLFFVSNVHSSIHPFIRTYDSLFPVTDYESLAFFLDAFRSIPRMASCKGLCFGHHFRPFSCSDTHFIDTFLGSTQEHDTMVFLEAPLVSIRRSYMAFNLNGRWFSDLDGFLHFSCIFFISSPLHATFFLFSFSYHRVRCSQVW